MKGIRHDHGGSGQSDKGTNELVHTCDSMQDRARIRRDKKPEAAGN